MFMKGKFRRRAGPAPPILALAALVVALLVAATTPLAVAKYVANGTGSASGTVAKWKFYYYTEGDTNPRGIWSGGVPSTKATAYLNGSHRDGPQDYNFCVFSDSQVAANVKVEIRYETSDGTVLPAPVTKNSPLFASYTVTDTTVGHGLDASTFGPNGWGEGHITWVGDLEADYEPVQSWAWFGISTVAPTPTPTGATIDGCMRSYKAFVVAEQID
jgi:hypothetical protein